MRNDVPSLVPGALSSWADLIGAMRVVQETEPNPPATEDEVEALEERLGGPLPEEYRSFLLHANGWAEFNGLDDLLPVSELPGQDEKADVLYELRDLKESLEAPGYAWPEYAREALPDINTQLSVVESGIVVARSSFTVRHAYLSPGGDQCGSVTRISMFDIVGQYPTFRHYFLAELTFAQANNDKD